MKRKTKWIMVVVVLLVLYLAGYGICRRTRVLLHTSNVLNLDIHGRYHLVVVENEESALARFAGHTYWPVRELEARYHGRGGRLD